MVMLSGFHAVRMSASEKNLGYGSPGKRVMGADSGGLHGTHTYSAVEMPLVRPAGVRQTRQLLLIPVER